MAPKQPASVQQVQQRLYRTLHDQLDLALYPQALRTVNKLLARDPADSLALHTRAQLVVALDRYPDALHLESTDELTRAYCLYKLARPAEARSALESAPDAVDAGTERAHEILEAQLSYRLGEYERARDLFDQLASTAEADSPELADLEVNLAACTSQLEFLEAVPATLADLASSAPGSGVPSVDELEQRPLALVLPSASTSAGAGAGPRGAATSDRPAAARTSRRRPRGARFAAAPASGAGRTEEGRPAGLPAELAAQPPPAEDRWIPKRQRPSMRDALLQAKEKQRGRKREKVMAAMQATQGAAAAGADESPAGKAAAGGGGKSGNAAGGGKKKKGGRK